MRVCTFELIRARVGPFKKWHQGQLLQSFFLCYETLHIAKWVYPGFCFILKYNLSRKKNFGRLCQRFVRWNMMSGTSRKDAPCPHLPSLLPKKKYCSGNSRSFICADSALSCHYSFFLLVSNLSVSRVNSIPSFLLSSAQAFSGNSSTLAGVSMTTRVTSRTWCR